MIQPPPLFEMNQTEQRVIPSGKPIATSVGGTESSVVDSRVNTSFIQVIASLMDNSDPSDPLQEVESNQIGKCRLSGRVDFLAPY